MTPDTPFGENRWKEIDQMVTPATLAARTRTCSTVSTLPIMSGLHPEPSAM